MEERHLPETWYVKEDDVRPARPDGTCFYCRQALTMPHELDCVIRSKRTKIVAEITYEIEIPASWTEEDVLFHRNEGTWCSSNMIQELENIDTCLCKEVKFRFPTD